MMGRSSKMQRIGVLVLLLVSFGSPAVAVANSPNAVIEESVVLLTKMLDGRKTELAADRKELYSLIDEILLPRFDRKFAAQIVLAKHWRTASEEQQARFIEAFYQALVRRYADGVLEFDPDKITVLPFRGDESKNRTKERVSNPGCGGLLVADPPAVAVPLACPCPGRLRTRRPRRREDGQAAEHAGR